MNPRNRPDLALHLLGLLLTASVATSVASAATTTGPTILSGTYSSTIVDWPTGKTGTVNITDTNDSESLTSAPIDANGHFTIKLPDPSTVKLKLNNVSGLFLPQSTFNPPSYKCVGQGTAAPQSAHYKELHLYAYIGSGEAIFLKLNSDPHQPSPVGLGYSALYYFDTATTLDGSTNCTNGIVTFRGTFPAGWSLPAGQQTSTEGAGTIRFTPDPLPANVTWHLYDLVTGVGIGLDSASAGSPGVKVTRVTAGSPAERAGIRVNDLIVEIDGKDTTALPLDQVLPLIRGAANTAVTLGVKRGAKTTIRRVEVIRAELQVP